MKWFSQMGIWFALLQFEVQAILLWLKSWVLEIYSLYVFPSGADLLLYLASMVLSYVMDMRATYHEYNRDTNFKHKKV